MARISKQAKFEQHLEGERAEARERISALRMQARAWRIIAIISAHDQALGKNLARRMILTSMPYVQANAVESLIADYEKVAEEYGIKSGLFVSSCEAA